MKREDVKNKIPGITDEQLDWLMGENGRDVTAERKKADGLQAQVDSLTTQVATAQDGLKALAEEKAWAFEAAEPDATGMIVNTGAEHGTAEDDGVAAAFASLNGTTKTAATETNSYKLVPGSQAGTEPQGRAFQCSTNEKSHPPASLRKGGFF